jgi:hypothetical protein
MRGIGRYARQTAKKSFGSLQSGPRPPVVGRAGAAWEDPRSCELKGLRAGEGSPP